MAYRAILESTKIKCFRQIMKNLKEEEEENRQNYNSINVIYQNRVFSFHSFSDIYLMLGFRYQLSIGVQYFNLFFFR